MNSISSTNDPNSEEFIPFGNEPYPPHRKMSFSEGIALEQTAYDLQQISDLERGILDRGCAADNYSITYRETPSDSIPLENF